MSWTSRAVKWIGCWLLVGLATPSAAQGPTPTIAEADGVLSDASFGTLLRLYTPPLNEFSPYFAWDAQMALGVTVFRKGSHAVLFGSTFQTVGTERLQKQVGVGGTGYLINFAYTRRASDALTISAGVGHLSSHLTRDLDVKLDQQRSIGAAIPIVEDPDEYNVLFLGWHRTWASARFSPRLDVLAEPTNFRFNGTWTWNERPIYIGSQWALWRGSGKSLALETQQEIGVRPFVNAFLLLNLFEAGEPEARLQLFLSVSPGHTLHVSPNIGGLRDGVAFGMRMRFRG